MDLSRWKQKIQDFFQSDPGFAIGVSLSAITIGAVCYEALHNSARRSSVDSSKKYLSDEEEKKQTGSELIQESKATTKSEKFRSRVQKQLLLPPKDQDKKTQQQKNSAKNEALRKKQIKNKKVFQTDLEATDFNPDTKADKMENLAKQSRTPHDKLFFTLLAKVAKDITEEGEN